ncbi:MAG: hypothetical protein ACRD4R_11800 [Candidatus Acidiferrales bacterium]
MYLKLRIIVLMFAIATCLPALARARQSAQRQDATPASDTIECRILEAHASTAPSALVVIFHQRDKQDQPHLAAMLKEKSGGSAEVQVGDAPWTTATVFRLKTCFGRGLLVLPPGSVAMKDGGTFRIRFSTDRAAN